MSARLQCPVDRTPLPEGGTHCPHCGLRVAALPPRRRRAANLDAVEPGPPPTARAAARRGLLTGAALAAVLVLAGLVVRATGHDGAAVTGDGCLVVGGLAVVGAAVSDGIRITRWNEADELRRRVRSGGTLGPTRVRLLAVALVPAIVVVILAVAR